MCCKVNTISRTMKLFAVFIMLPMACAGAAMNVSTYRQANADVSASIEPEEAVCNVRECGCPPYRRPWCTERNARVHSPWCQFSRRRCMGGCDEVWCRPGPKPPAPAPSPSPPPPKLKVFLLFFFGLTHINHQLILYLPQHSLRCITSGARMTTSVTKPTTRIPTSYRMDMCLDFVRSSWCCQRMSRPFAMATVRKTPSTVRTPRSRLRFTRWASRRL